MLLSIARSDFDFFSRLISCFYLFSTMVIILIFNLFLYSINQDFNIFYKNMDKFCAKNNSILSLRLKLKLMNAMKRCGERRRLIGFFLWRQVGDYQGQFKNFFQNMNFNSQIFFIANNIERFEIITKAKSFKMWILFVR